MLSHFRLFTVVIPVVASMILLGWSMAIESPSYGGGPILDPAATSPGASASSLKGATSGLNNEAAPCQVHLHGLSGSPGTAHTAAVSLLPGTVQGLPALNEPADIRVVEGELAIVVSANARDQTVTVSGADGEIQDQLLRFGEIIQIQSGSSISIPAGIAANIHSRDAAALVIYSVVRPSSPIGGPTSPLSESLFGVNVRISEFPLDPGENLTVDCRDLL